MLHFILQKLHKAYLCWLTPYIASLFFIPKAITSSVQYMLILFLSLQFITLVLFRTASSFMFPCHPLPCPLLFMRYQMSDLVLLCLLVYYLFQSISIVSLRVIWLSFFLLCMFSSWVFTVRDLPRSFVAIMHIICKGTFYWTVPQGCIYDFLERGRYEIEIR